MSSIYLYAELLLNIRQITVFATLPSDCHPETSVQLDHGGKNLSIQHESLKASLELPAQVSEATDFTLPSTPTKDLSFRLRVSAVSKLPVSIDSPTYQVVPWSASKLSSKTQLSCQSCGNLLVADIKEWKDLPSGGWADMMDFWHCHKPTCPNEGQESVFSTKGYAAANDLGPTNGVGLVDIGHFRFAKNDCLGFQVCDPLDIDRFLGLMVSKFDPVRTRRRWSALKIDKFHSSATDTIVPEQCSAVPAVGARLTFLLDL